MQIPKYQIWIFYVNQIVKILLRSKSKNPRTLFEKRHYDRLSKNLRRYLDIGYLYYRIWDRSIWIPPRSGPARGRVSNRVPKFPYIIYNNFSWFICNKQILSFIYRKFLPKFGYFYLVILGIFGYSIWTIWGYKFIGFGYWQIWIFVLGDLGPANDYEFK